MRTLCADRFNCAHTSPQNSCIIYDVGPHLCGSLRSIGTCCAALLFPILLLLIILLLLFTTTTNNNNNKNKFNCSFLLLVSYLFYDTMFYIYAFYICLSIKHPCEEHPSHGIGDGGGDHGDGSCTASPWQHPGD